MKITLYGLCESIRTYLEQNCGNIVNITVKKPLLSDFYSNDQHTLGFYPRTQWLKLRHGMINSTTGKYWMVLI